MLIYYVFSCLSSFFSLGIRGEFAFALEGPCGHVLKEEKSWTTNGCTDVDTDMNWTCAPGGKLRLLPLKRKSLCRKGCLHFKQVQQDPQMLIVSKVQVFSDEQKIKMDGQRLYEVEEKLVRHRNGWKEVVHVLQTNLDYNRSPVIW